MIHDVDAIYDHGVLRPVEPLVLPEGARVHLRVEERNGRPAEPSTEATNYEGWLDGLAGRWQGEFVRGNEGNYETRESLP
jgi:predicted DNA-binding antitoxin AbrB/MazE fold protein